MRILDAPRLLEFPVKAYYHTGEIVLATAAERQTWPVSKDMSANQTIYRDTFDAAKHPWIHDPVLYGIPTQLPAVQICTVNNVRG